MSEGGMTDIMHEGQSLGQFTVQPQRYGNGTRDLRHFQRMRQPVTKMIRESRCENLCLRFQPSKSARMNDAVPVASVFATITVCIFAETAAAGLIGVHGPRGGCRN